MKILLDTSAYVGFKRNVAEIVDCIVSADPVLFSPIVLAELITTDQHFEQIRGLVYSIFPP